MDVTIYINNYFLNIDYDVTCPIQVYKAVNLIKIACFSCATKLTENNKVTSENVVLKYSKMMNVYFPIRAIHYCVQILHINALYKYELYTDARPEIRTCLNIQTIRCRWDPSSMFLRSNLRGLVVLNK